MWVIHYLIGSDYRGRQDYSILLPLYLNEGYESTNLTDTHVPYSAVHATKVPIELLCFMFYPQANGKGDS